MVLRDLRARRQLVSAASRAGGCMKRRRQLPRAIGCAAEGRARGTTLVPTDTSDASRMSTGVDTWDAGDAPGRIYTHCHPAGGRKVAGSNPVAPTSRKPASGAGFRHLGVDANWPGASAVVPAVVPNEAGVDLGPAGRWFKTSRPTTRKPASGARTGIPGPTARPVAVAGARPATPSWTPPPRPRSTTRPIGCGTTPTTTTTRPSTPSCRSTSRPARSATEY